MQLEKRRTHFFPSGGEHVITAQLPDGRYIAYFMHYYHRSSAWHELRGYGTTRLGAIANLNELYQGDDD